MDAPPPLVTLAIAAWGAVVATALAARDIWRGRFRVTASLAYRSDPNLGDEILITNLGDKPVTLRYWEIVFLHRRWPRPEVARAPIGDDGELVARALPPGDTCHLHFKDFYHFDLSPRLIYIRLHFAGRRPTLRLIYGPRHRRH